MKRALLIAMVIAAGVVASGCVVVADGHWRRGRYYPPAGAYHAPPRHYRPPAAYHVPPRHYRPPAPSHWRRDSGRRGSPPRHDRHSPRPPAPRAPRGGRRR